MNVDSEHSTVATVATLPVATVSIALLLIAMIATVARASDHLTITCSIPKVIIASYYCNCKVYRNFTVEVQYRTDEFRVVVLIFLWC